ncbi:hypothetical protein Tcan_05853 [Toxocara canis]|uniref:Uncharacterized protein n=1 Tax=Toxocara canis TaxID=6265 RepID=A0A0B2VVP1_TOXCA|nr:hypothetical protein Tcan_05853 [Toxocara canis]
MGELDVGDAPCSSAVSSPVITSPTSAAHPALPDRQAFQRSLSEYNEHINMITHEIDVILGTNGEEGKLKVLREQKAPLRARRDELKREADARKPQISELRKQLDNKDKVLSDIENDLIYKKEEQLNERLRSLEEAYNRRGFTSVRDEQALVKEIDKLKRNQNKLANYNSVMEERRLIETRLQAANAEQSKVFKSIRQLTHELQSIYNEIGRLQNVVSEMRVSLRDLYAKKKELVEKYNNDRELYISWLKSKKEVTDTSVRHVGLTDRSYPATFPATQRGQQITSFEDELEPFFEQKRDCRRMIAYLESLKAQMEPNERTTPDDDSADEMPSSFVTLTKHASLPARTSVDSVEVPTSELFVQKLKRKAYKKSAKKPSQPVCHRLELVRLFNELEVELPLYYQDVPRALDELKELLEFYEQQTNVVVWEESDYQNLELMSESECTLDSALNGSTDMSERERRICLGNLKNCKYEYILSKRISWQLQMHVCAQSTAKNCDGIEFWCVCYSHTRHSCFQVFLKYS